ncbi:XRE family transcriptional regulator [Chromatiales bacterium (ex Bugula neritina AB1)]|nr:XRE family transcriptional regulator [Chromatiales bacterium (ex Bugula neritina AB1)]
MYDVIGTDATEYEGVFITAVKTTGIFCRPACRARKPKFENVIFYDNAQQALQAGFRACKVCKPMEPLGETPDYIRQIIVELHENPYLRIKDQDLRNRNIEPVQIRRWFKKHHGITFHAYQRMIRISAAFNTIGRGAKVSDTAFDSGYESLSGFNQSYRSIFGEPPTAVNKKSVINIERFSTPVGPMYACATEKGICLLEFTDRKMLETEFRDIRKRLNAAILPGENWHLSQVKKELAEYFAGNRKQFEVSLDTPGTEFQRLVWEKLLQIPYGSTRSYSQQAKILDRPTAVRAVASANGSNRISIIVPCHRVIGADGNLTGYGGGLHRKKWLLELEGAA